MTDAVQADTRVDPRQLLGAWANSSDEWVRYIVRVVLTGAGPLNSDEEDHAYTLFRQEKALDARELSTEDQLAMIDGEDEALEPLTVTSLSEVAGVNALIGGGVIEPHQGLTILFGENGTGKTGYSRIFKALAASRTADVILGDIEATAPQSPSATIGYQLGAEAKTYAWTGQRGVAPFTRISIFDSPSVSFHVDEDLEYVYVPAALALFNHVIAGIKAVQARIDAAISDLRSGPTGLLGRFPRAASVYPLIETLGAATDLDQLRAMADHHTDADTRIGTLRRTVAALEADTISAEITLQQRAERVLAEASTAAQILGRFSPATYSSELTALAYLQEEYRAFRAALFEAADLPAAPDDTWTRFIQAGEEYEAHLSAHDAHDADRCLYCRQPLSDPARALIGKYSEFLEEKIAGDIEAAKGRLSALTSPVFGIRTSDVDAYARDHATSNPQPVFLPLLERTLSTATALLVNRPGFRSVLQARMESMNQKYSVEMRERALRMLDEAKPDHPNLMAAVRHVAGLLGMSPETLRVWHRRREVDAGVRPGVPTDVAAENAQLRRENAELRKANEVLKAASVFFAKELDRPSTR